MGKLTSLKNSHKTQKPLFFWLKWIFLPGFLCLLFPFQAVEAYTLYTPEELDAIEALDNQVREGLRDPSEVEDFIEDLDSKEGSDHGLSLGCGLGVKLDSEVDSCITDFKDEEHVHLSALQSVQPLKDSLPFPFLSGEGWNKLGAVSVNINKGDLYQRHLEMHNANLSLALGHIYPSLQETRIPFVAGRKFYQGYTGESGFDGFLASRFSALDGVVLTYRLNNWIAQMSSAWNRFQPKSSSETENRRDGIFHSLGVRQKQIRLQVVHQKFESSHGNDLELWLAGAQIKSVKDLWQFGAAVSNQRTNKNGAFGELVFGDKVSQHDENSKYGLELHQASLDWVNPLQNERGLLKDTTEKECVFFGEGEGGFKMHSVIPLWEKIRVNGLRNDFLKSQIMSGSQVDWSLIEQDLIRARFRMALMEEWKNFSYSIGSSFVYRRASSKYSNDMNDLMEEVNGGLGQTLTYHGENWKVKMSLIEQSDDYAGPYPEPFHMSFEQGNKSGEYCRFEVVTGQLREPTRYLRLNLKQNWQMGKKLSLSYALRLPWSEDQGFANDLGFQFGGQIRF